MRNRLRLVLAVGMLLCAHGAQAAAFVPGRTEPDPPTGDLGASRPGGEEPVAAGNGIRWAFGRWRYNGDLSLDLRWSRLSEGSSSTQMVTSGNINFASYIWQPWFIQVRTGIGLTVGRSLSGGGAGGDGGSASFGVTGHAQLRVFPASRFPFGIRAGVSDSRSTGESLLSHYRAYTLSLSQNYRPPTGPGTYEFGLDHSRVVSADGGRDSLLALHGTGLWQWPEQSIDASVNFSDNRRDDRAPTRVWGIGARHSFRPASALAVDTIATWNRLELGTRQTLDGGGSTRTDSRQIATSANWRPLPGDWLYSEESPVTVAGGARIAETSSEGTSARTFGLSGGISKQFSSRLRASAFAAYSLTTAAIAGSTSDLTVNASGSYTPESRQWGEWRYNPALNAGAVFSQSSKVDPRTNLSLQGSHSLTRSWLLDAEQTVSFNFSQGGSVTTEFPAQRNTYGISHGMGLNWLANAESGSSTAVGLSLSDARTKSETNGSFQFANLQVSRRDQISRFRSWGASLTAQASRSNAEQLLNGELQTLDTGWQVAYSGSINYDNQRAFGIPRLHFSALLSANTQQVERRAAGDVNAPIERISASLETRLEYSIGQLTTRLLARAARVEGRSVYSIIARAQRTF